MPSNPRPALEGLAGNLVLSVQPRSRCKTRGGRHSQALGIENKSHYTRDVTLREDASRIRKIPASSRELRSFAYNILRCNQSDTIAQDRYARCSQELKFNISMTFSGER